MFFLTVCQCLCSIMQCLGSPIKEQFHPILLTYSCCYLIVRVLYNSFVSFISWFYRANYFLLWKDNISKVIRIEQEKYELTQPFPVAVQRSITQDLTAKVHTNKLLDIDNSIKIRRLAQLQLFSFCS